MEALVSRVLIYLESESKVESEWAAADAQGFLVGE